MLSNAGDSRKKFRLYEGFASLLLFGWVFSHNSHKCFSKWETLFFLLNVVPFIQQTLGNFDIIVMKLVKVA